jgi:hypothetical protein
MVSAAYAVGKNIRCKTSSFNSNEAWISPVKDETFV